MLNIIENTAVRVHVHRLLFRTQNGTAAAFLSYCVRSACLSIWSAKSVLDVSFVRDSFVRDIWVNHVEGSLSAHTSIHG
jgi:hypothetical protein